MRSLHRNNSHFQRDKRFSINDGEKHIPEQKQFGIYKCSTGNLLK